MEKESCVGRNDVFLQQNSKVNCDVSVNAFSLYLRIVARMFSEEKGLVGFIRKSTTPWNSFGMKETTRVTFCFDCEFRISMRIIEVYCVVQALHKEWIFWNIMSKISCKAFMNLFFVERSVNFSENSLLWIVSWMHKLP